MPDPSYAAHEVTSCGAEPSLADPHKLYRHKPTAEDGKTCSFPSVTVGSGEVVVKSS